MKTPMPTVAPMKSPMSTVDETNGLLLLSLSSSWFMLLVSDTLAGTNMTCLFDKRGVIIKKKSFFLSISCGN